jgi:glycosyltransferase involved in cell wall biosynthesis
MDNKHLEELILDLGKKIDSIRGIRAISVGQETSERPCKLTFISPCYNESENLEALYKRITGACRQNKIEDYEIIWIENGSADNSMEIMTGLHRADPRLRIFQLSRNFGYQGAITCGLSQARGEWISVLDADLQDPPELIIEMLNLAKKDGYDVVYGVRKTRKEGPFLRFAYSVFYRLWKLSADIQIPLDAGDFGIMHHKVADSINALPERQRFIRGLRAWVGFRQCGFPYDRQSRQRGTTKFNLSGMISLALDGLISYSVIPLRLSVIAGFFIVVGALLLSSYQGVLRLLSYVGVLSNTLVLPPGLTQINLVLVGLSGLNIITIGIVGEYIGRIYNESKDRPGFIVKSVLS